MSISEESKKEHTSEELKAQLLEAYPALSMRFYDQGDMELLVSHDRTNNLSRENSLANLPITFDSQLDRISAVITFIKKSLERLPDREEYKPTDSPKAQAEIAKANVASKLQLEKEKWRDFSTAKKKTIDALALILQNAEEAVGVIRYQKNGEMRLIVTPDTNAARINAAKLVNVCMKEAGIVAPTNPEIKR